MHLLLKGIAAVLLATSVSAASIGRADKADAVESLKVYDLKLNCNENSYLDGRQLELEDSILSVHQNSSALPIQFYPMKNPNNDELSSLHAYPIGIVDHALGLVGENGVYTFQDVATPKSTDSEIHWQTFKLGANNLLTNEIPGHWRVYPKDGERWEVKWVNGAAITTEDYLVVDVAYQRVTKLS